MTLLAKVVRFLIVGISAFLVYLGAMWFMLDQMGQGSVLAAAVAFVLATVVSYVGNTLWAFKAPSTAGTAGRFLVVVSFGLIANLAIAAALGKMGFGYAIISIAVYLVVPALNFLGHHLWTFRLHSPKTIP